MLVGPTGGGKSRNLHVLEDTLGQLKVLGEQGFAYEKVKIYQLNPKSITMGPRRGVEVDLELELDGVAAMASWHRVDAVFMIIRASTRLPRQFRDCMCATQVGVLHGRP